MLSIISISLILCEKLRLSGDFFCEMLVILVMVWVWVWFLVGKWFMVVCF